MELPMLHTPESSKCTSEKRNILIETLSVAFWGSLKGIIKRKSWTIFLYFKLEIAIYVGNIFK